MTRRWSIAGGGVCSLVLLPGCLGGNLNNTANGARPGYVLNDPSRPPGYHINGVPSAVAGPVAGPQPPAPQPYTLIGRRSTDPLPPASPAFASAPRMQPVAAAVPTPNAPETPAADASIPPPDPVRPASASEAAAPAEAKPEAKAEPKSDQPVGADWDKISQALGGNSTGSAPPAAAPSGGSPSTTPTRTAGTFAASPIAMLSLPIKTTGAVLAESEPRRQKPSGRSMKLSDPPATPPTLTSPAPPVTFPSIPPLESPPTLPPAPPPVADPAAAPAPILPPPAADTTPPAPAGPAAPAPAPASARPSADSPLVLAVRAFQEKRHEEAVEYLKQYDPSNQEVLLYLMPLMVRLGEGNLAAMPPEELAAYVDRLQGASGVMRAKAALRLDTVCFCRQVFNYGKYERLDPHGGVQPGETVHVYAEIHNFTWEPAAPGRGYVMRLTHALEIRDAQGRVVWRTEPRPKDDVRQTPPTDYYLVYSFAMPDSLPPGTYTLTVQVTDKPTGRLVRRPVEFRLGSR